jgi:hypothetical protein
VAHRTRRLVGTKTARVAAAVATLLLALVAGTILLPDLPGQHHSAQAATGATLPAATLSAGLAQVRSIQGVFVPDGQSTDEQSVVDRVIFAASSNGDSSFDVRYRPDYQARQQQWRAALKADPRVAVDDPTQLEMAGALTRELVVMNGESGLQQTKSWIVNPFTHEVVGVRYRFYGGLDFPAASGGRSVEFVWLLSHMLDTALDAGAPRVIVQGADYAGEPAERAVVFNSNGKPAYEALIDRRYGLVERVTSLQGSRELPANRLVPFHLESLKVNQPVARDLFVMRPDHRFAPSGIGPPKPTDTPDKYGIDFDEQAVPIADLSRFTSSWTLLPTWLPAGYWLASAHRTTDGQQLWLIYRLGMDELTVGTAGTHDDWIDDGEIGHGFVVQTWPSDPQEGGYGWTAIGNAVSALRSGAMKGWPAGAGSSEEPGRNFVGTVAFGVSGTSPVSTLRRVAESVRPAKPGPHLPGSAYDWWPWLVAMAATVALALAWRRAATPAATQPEALSAAQRAPSMRRARLTLIGVAAVVFGALLSWHRLYGAGDFAVRGWQEPLAILTVSLALFAGAAALLAPGTAARPRLTPRVLTILLGLATLAGALLSVVYLPVKARFVTTDFEYTAPSWTSFHSLHLNWGCPLPGPGLWLAIAGALLIVVGGFAMRTRRPAAAPEP